MTEQDEEFLWAIEDLPESKKNIIIGYIAGLAGKDFCGDERPARKVFCQMKKGHKGSHSAVIFWE